MKIKTAVEWLAEEYAKYIQEPWKYNKQDIIKQAKEIEKEQHSETFNQCVQWMQYHIDLVNGGAEYWHKEPLYFLEYFNKIYNK